MKRWAVQTIVASMAATAGVYAQDYPGKPVRIVVPSSPGGAPGSAGGSDT